MAVTTSHSDHAQVATMTPPSKSPVHRASSSFFQLATTKKRMHNRVQEQLQREKAAMQEEAMLRGQAWLYLDDFLRRSPWEDMMDQIAIVREAVPTMPELNSYGGLDEEEGTKACRRLFKAVVVWDELGHSLWKTLRAASEQRQLAQRQFEQIDARCTDVAFYIAASRRSPRRASEASDLEGLSDTEGLSDLETGSDVSPHGSVCGEKHQQPFLKLSRKASSSSSSSSRRASSESTQCGTECSPRSTASPGGSRSAIPKGISHNCVSAVRKTLGVFSESRSSLSMGRQHSR